jgi:heat shock protein HtpX
MTTMRRWNNHLRTVLLLGALTALLVGVGGAMAPGHLPLFLVLAITLNVGSYFFSDRLVLRMSGAQEVAPGELPELHGMVRELAQRAEIPMPRLYVIDDMQPNAFATGRNPAHGVVAVTRGILAMLAPRELRGVLAHEIAHIRNRDILVATVAACVAGAIGYAAHAFGFLGLGARQSDDEEHSSPLAGLAMMLLAPIAATLIQLGISRSREYLADETGARLSGDPLALAGALGRLENAAQIVPSEAAQPATASLYIVNPFAAGARLAGWFSTHPSTEERIRRLHALAGSGAAT